MSKTDPTANAFLFVVDDNVSGKQFDMFLDTKSFDVFTFWDLRYRAVGSLDKWTYVELGDATFDANLPPDLSTIEKTTAEMERIVNRVNTILAEKFGAQTSPKFGIELLLFWLKSGAVSESNNVLEFKRP